MLRTPRLGTILMALAGALAAAAVATGLGVLYWPTDQKLKLRFHESLAAVADSGRLARCAWIVTGNAQASEAAAVEALKSRHGRADQAGCSWYTELEGLPDMNIEWTRLSATSVQLCTDVKISPREDARRSEIPDFTFPEINNSDLREGRQCWTLHVDAVPHASRWGSVLPDPP